MIEKVFNLALALEEKPEEELEEEIEELEEEFEEEEV